MTKPIKQIPTKEPVEPIETVDQKAERLSIKFQCKVVPIIMQDTLEGEDIVGFLKMPNIRQKLAVLDKALMGGYSTASELVDLCVIREESDHRIWDAAEENADLYIGTCVKLYDMVKYSVDQSAFKKK